MNRRRTHTTARIFAAFAVMAVLLAASPMVHAGSCVAKRCPGSVHAACCQTQSSEHGCCGGETSHECPSMVSCETKVWLPPQVSGDDPTPRGSLRGDFARLVWQTETVSFSRPILFARSNSLIEQHIRLQI